MRFLHTHRKDILELMAAGGYKSEQFDYVKRRGRIHIIEPETGRSFIYFRRKRTELHPETRQWVESETFEVSTDGGKPVVVDLWVEVRVEFKEWLSRL